MSALSFFLAPLGFLFAFLGQRVEPLFNFAIAVFLTNYCGFLLINILGYPFHIKHLYVYLGTLIVLGAVFAAFAHKFKHVGRIVGCGLGGLAYASVIMRLIPWKIWLYLVLRIIGFSLGLLAYRYIPEFFLMFSSIFVGSEHVGGAIAVTIMGSVIEGSKLAEFQFLRSVLVSITFALALITQLVMKNHKIGSQPATQSTHHV